MNSRYPEKVIDEKGQVHVLKDLLGEGGQGAVFRTADPSIAVKWIEDRSPVRRERLRAQLQVVRSKLALPEMKELPIAHPHCLLKPPNVGYAMKLLTGMAAMSHLVRVPRGKPADVFDWYTAGGGLVRRLRILARAAEVLNSLHAASLVYADPSPNNIFVSSDPSAEEVYLIDTDNLHTQTASGPAIYTPGFGAPELVKGRSGVNSLTDAHAFSVIAFWTLALVHPLIGDFVHDGEPEMEEKALAGELPWIDHSTDGTNRTVRGLPRQFALSVDLQRLAREAFEDGVNDPTRRPGLGKWADLLHAAADITVLCPGCRWSYYFRTDAGMTRLCPRCDRPRPGCVLVTIQRWEPSRGDGPGKVVYRHADEKKRHLGVAGLVLGTEPLCLTARITEALGGRAGRYSRLELTRVNRGVKVRVLGQGDFWYSSEDGRESGVISTSTTIPFQYRLHFGRKDEPHRVAIFFDVPEVRG